MPVLKDTTQLIFSSYLQAPDYPTALSAIENIFTLNYVHLRTYFQPAWNTFRLLKNGSLITREGIKAEIESFLQTADRGILILEGAGGTGKTTFLAQWAVEKGAIHHFLEVVPNRKNLQAAKISLAAQLIRFFELADFMPVDKFENEIHSPNLLLKLLLEGSKRGNFFNHDHKIFIVIDGLENSGLSQDTGALGLPETLPENMYVILTKSTQQRPFATNLPTKIIHLDQTQALYQSDMRQNFQRALENTSYSATHKQQELDQVFEILLEKACGNWIHLNHLIQLLADPEISQHSIEDLWNRLPGDLFQSYLQLLNKLKDKDHADWYHYLLPVLGVLAASPEPITLPRLALESGNLTDFSRLKNQIDQSLIPFLTVDYQEKYQFNHISLKELMSGNFQHGKLSPQEEAFLLELVENSRLIHLRFAQEILSSWGGLEAGLPGLKSSVKLTAREEYGLDYLFTHLEGAGSIDDLKRLLNLQWQKRQTKRPKTLSATLSTKNKIETDEPEDKSQLANAWYEAKRSHNRLPDFLEDLEKAWIISNSIGDQVRLALMRSSMMVIPSKSGDEGIHDTEEQDQLIGRLSTCFAESGEIDEAFAAVEMIRSDHWKSQALIRISSFLPSSSISTILRLSKSLNDQRGKIQIITNCALHLTELSKPVQALEIAEKIPNLTQRNKTLSQIASKLMESSQTELALEAIHIISDESTQVELLRLHAKNLNREELQVALTLIRAFQDDERKVQALTGLAPYLPPPLQRECFQWLQQVTELSRSRALVELIPYINESFLKDGLSSAREIKDENLRAPVLVELIKRTAATGNPGKALKLVPAILGENHIASAIAGIAPFLSEEQLLETVEMSTKFKDEPSLRRVLESLIPFLGEPELTHILEKVYINKNRAAQSAILSALIKRYHALGEQGKSLEIIRNCSSQDIRARLLVNMAPLWSAELKKEALRVTLEIEVEESQAIALLGLLPHLQTSELIEFMSSAVELPNQGWNSVNRRTEILITTGILLVEKGEINTALSILNEIEDEESLALAVRQLIPVLSDDPQIKAFGMMQRIQDPKKRITLLSEIVPWLPVYLINDVLNSLRDEEEWVRLEAVGRLAPHIPIECLHNFLQLVLDIHDQSVRSQSLTELVQKWLILPVPESLSLWNETILSLSNQPRPDFLVDLSKLTPVINDLGGVNAVKETLLAVKDVVTWWN